MDAFAVGTAVAVSADAPLPGLGVQAGSARRPASSQAVTGQGTAPDAKQVWRAESATLADTPDVLALRAEPAPAGCEPRLVPVLTVPYA